MAGFRDMGTHERVIFVLSVIDIVEAAVLIMVGFAANIANMSVEASQGGQSAQIMIASMVFMVLGAITLAMGVLGVRAARDVTKIKPIYYLSMATLGLNVLGMVSAPVVGGGDLFQYAVSLVLSGLMFYCARSIKQRVDAA